MDGKILFRRRNRKKRRKHRKSNYTFLIASQREKETLKMIRDLMEKYQYDESVNLEKANTVAADRDRYGFGWLKGCSYTCKEHADDLKSLLYTITNRIEE